MCGIAGLVNLSNDCQQTLSRMLDSIAHRGPDDTGMWLDDAGVALGHRRLAIIDASPAGHQPMASASDRFVLTFNGEIYNHLALRAELKSAGMAPDWRGHCDTETLLAGFEAWGINATLERCNGMFALVVWDTRQRTLTLARDRMGEKPLYFGWVGQQFAFASEMKALTHVPGWSAHMHPAAIASFLAAGYVRGPQSAVRGIYRLPPACSLTLSLSQLRQPQDWAGLSQRLVRYWSLESVVRDGQASLLTDAAAATDALEKLLREAVGMRMLADVPLGAFLSGGIDSSLVAALMQTQSARPVKTFSVGFKDARFDEAPFARTVAAHLGTEHTELYVGANDALALVPTLAQTFDEPFADSSQIPTLLLSKLTREHVTVSLSGDGGDELFAGYARYFAILRLWRVLGPLPAALRRGISPMLKAAATALRPVAPMMRSTRQLPHRLSRLAKRISAGDIDAMQASFIGGAALQQLQCFENTDDAGHCLPPTHIRDPLRRLLYGDQCDYLPDDILHKVDRASMAYSLEARVPFLDHRVVEFSWQLPTAMLTDRRNGKLLLRRILDRHVPRSLIDRPKQGFAPPMDAWLRGPLREWSEALLSQNALRDLPMLDATAVRSLWRAHLNQHVDAGAALWSVLMLADWRRHMRASM